MDFTVIGDAVNLAARRQEMTKEYDSSILISGEVVSQLDGGFSTRFLRERLHHSNVFVFLRILNHHHLNPRRRQKNRRQKNRHLSRHRRHEPLLHLLSRTQIRPCLLRHHHR